MRLKTIGIISKMQIGAMNKNCQIQITTVSPQKFEQHYLKVLVNNLKGHF